MENNKRLLLVLNPVAGKNQAKRHAFELINFFSGSSYEVTVYPTVEESSENVLHIARRAKDFDLVVCCGGDGTLSETLNGVLRSKHRIPLGYIPMGTTNDFATTFGIPSDPRMAARKIADFKPMKIDCGWFNGRAFSYVAATGAFTTVSYSVPSSVKNIAGHFAYVAAGIASIPSIRAMNMKIQIDGEAIEGDFLYLSITNSYTLAGLFKLDKNEVDLNDGMLEVLTIRKPENASDYKSVAACLLKQDFNTSCVKIYKGKEIKISSDAKMSWTLDGENGGKYRHVTVKTIHNKVLLLGGEEV